MYIAKTLSIVPTFPFYVDIFRTLFFHIKLNFYSIITCKIVIILWNWIGIEFFLIDSLWMEKIIPLNKICDKMKKFYNVINLKKSLIWVRSLVVIPSFVCRSLKSPLILFLKLRWVDFLLLYDIYVRLCEFK